MTRNDDGAVPPELLHDVQAVLAAAVEALDSAGWRRNAPEQGRKGGFRLVDAVNYASAQAMVDAPTHRAVFACVAMAVEPHAGIPAHSLLHDVVADEYLSPDADDERLHTLDAAIVVAYNADVCGGVRDARDLLAVAFEQAPAILAAQDRGADA
jgi:hypothetical protein